MIEQIYSDFTTKLLPSIQSGLAITKDYFIELFGRYVKYLIITDIIAIVESMILIVLAIMLFKYTKKSWDARSTWANNSYANDRVPETLGFVISLLLSVVSILTLITNVDDLVKSVYVPEIRVYEEINSYRNSVTTPTAK